MRCIQCGQDKEPEAFPKSGPPCKACRARERRMFVLFSISLAEYDEVLQGQDGGCAICGRKPKSIRLSVDHDHRTGEVRGILCSSCNRGLRWFEDKPELMLAGAKYLAEPPLPRILGREVIGVTGRVRKRRRKRRREV